MFDVGKKTLAFAMTPVAGMKSCGPVAALGDRLVGVGRVGKKHVLYVVDLAARKTLTAAEAAQRSINLKTGPDGKVYGFLGSVLVRIDPQTFALERLGAIDKPGEIEFLGNDIYVAGRPELRRVRNATALP